MTTGRGRVGKPRPNSWFIWLLAVSLLVHTSVGVARPMVSYRVLELGVSASYLGVVSAMFAVVPLVVGITIGRWVDQYGPRRFQIVGAVMLAVSGLGLGLLDRMAGIMAMFALCGLAHLLMMVATQTTVANESDDDTIDRWFGYYTFVASIGQMLGPLIGGLVAGGVGGVDGTRAALLVGGGIAVLCVPLAVAIPSGVGRPRRVEGDAEGDADAKPVAAIRSVLSTPGLTGSLLVSFIVIATVDILTVYLPALGEERGWSVGAVSALLVARAAASTVSRIGIGWMVARVGRIRLLFLAVLISGLAVVALPLAGSLPAAMVAMVVAGLALGLCQPLTMAWVATETTPRARGRALSVRISANRLGQVTVPAAAGLMAGFAGTAGVLGVVGSAVLATGVVVRRADGR
ncbi:MAG TPA: MFS transporter [Nocardioidaceae bacterium]|nr:MFS transporter [Nocardioidaceae bacterium]